MIGGNLSRVKVQKNKDGTLSVVRTICSASDGGIMVRLMNRPELKQGVRVLVTQSADGKKFYGSIVEDKA